jgi:hypothetical protein
MKRKIVETERLEMRGKRGRAIYRCKLECGHGSNCGTKDVKRGWAYCMECYFADGEKK